MTPEQETAAIELCRRVNVEFLEILARVYDGTGDPDAAYIGRQLRDLAILLESADELTVIYLREAVLAARSRG